MYVSITNVTTFEDQLSIIDIERLVVTVDKLLELKRNVCPHIFHNGNLCGSSLHYEIFGSSNVKVIQWNCDKKHVGKWCSSEILTRRNKTPSIIMVSSLQPVHCRQVTIGVKCLYFARDIFILERVPAKYCVNF